jgi:hypothetical protein
LGLAVFVATVPGYGQDTQASRPYRGLFGGGVGETAQLLVASASLGGGYDDSLLSDARGGGTRIGDLRSRHRGGIGQATGTLSYSLARGAAALGASAGTSARYYPSLGTVYRREYAAAQGSLRVVKGLSIQGAVAYQPYSLSSLYPLLFSPSDDDSGGPLDDSGVALDDEFISSPRHFLTYSGGAGYQYQLARRTSVGASYSYRERVSAAQGDTTFQRQRAGAVLTQNVGRDLDLTIGYGYTQARYAGDRRVEDHHIDLGVNYHRALSISLSRQTTVSFSTGMSARARPEGEDTRRRFAATGSAQLVHEIGRTWAASIAYNRRVRFTESWPEPVFSDAVSAGFGGLITRRLQFQSSARASVGRVGFEEIGSGFDTYAGSATLAYALSRYASVGATYAYYRHRFDDRVLLAPGFARHLDRQSIRGYVNVWMPLFSRPGRP